VILEVLLQDKEDAKSAAEFAPAVLPGACDSRRSRWSFSHSRGSLYDLIFLAGFAPLRHG
jgi:hypothetical protein